MGATVKHDGIDGTFYLTIMIFKLIAKCLSRTSKNSLNI